MMKANGGKSMIKCTYCGAKGLGDSRTCSSCGATFTEEQYQQLRKKRTRSKVIKYMVIAAAFAVAVAMTIVVVKFYVYRPLPDPEIVPCNDPYEKYLRIEERSFRKTEDYIELGVVITNTGTSSVQSLVLGYKVFNKSGETIKSKTVYVFDKSIVPRETVSVMVYLGDFDIEEYESHRMVVQNLSLGTPSGVTSWKALKVFDGLEVTGADEFVRHEYRYDKTEGNGVVCLHLVARVTPKKGYQIIRLGHVLKLYDDKGNMIGESLKYAVQDNDSYSDQGPPILSGEKRTFYVIACTKDEDQKIAGWKLFVETLGVR